MNYGHIAISQKVPVAGTRVHGTGTGSARYSRQHDINFQQFFSADFFIFFNFLFFSGKTAYWLGKKTRILRILQFLC